MAGKLIRVQVKPNASHNRILSRNEDELVVAIKAPAEKGKANAELIRFLSKELGPVQIKSGFSSKKKLVRFL